MIPTRALAHGASASGLMGRGGRCPLFCGGEKGAERNGCIRHPPPALGSCDCGFIVASTALTPAFHLAGEMVASSDLQRQPGD